MSLKEPLGLDQRATYKEGEIRNGVKQQNTALILLGI